VGLLIRRASRDAVREETKISKERNLRRLSTKTCDRETGHGVSEHSLSVAGIIEAGDFKIDLDQRTVILRGRELQLSSEEFDVLVFLARHPQSMVTPYTVLATNWTAHRARRTAFLGTLISLRKKIDAAGLGRHYLRTEPWVIYRFDPASSSTP